jgi:hypothetical protein
MNRSAVTQTLEALDIHPDEIADERYPLQKVW